MTQTKNETKLNRNGNRRGMHPNSQNNIKNNKNHPGRPKKEHSITNLIREMLDQEAQYIAPGALPTDKTWRQLIARAILRKASDGDVSMIRELLDRLEGKVVQPVGGENGEPIKVEHDIKGKLLSLLDRYASNGTKEASDS